MNNQRNSHIKTAVDKMGSWYFSKVTATPNLPGENLHSTLRANNANGIIRVKRKSFTIIEVLVSVAVVSILAVSAGSTFVTMGKAWNRQKNCVYLVQSIRWAMDSIIREAREATINGTPGWARLNDFGGGDTLEFGKDRNGDGDVDNSDRPTIFYWQGNGGTLGDIDKLYRGEGNNFNQANGNRQVVLDSIVANPSGNVFFNLNGGDVLTIELTVRPRPANLVGSENKDYTLRSNVFIRN